jgi:hypothetical protein
MIPRSVTDFKVKLPTRLPKASFTVFTVNAALGVVGTQSRYTLFLIHFVLAIHHKYKRASL